MAGAIRASVGGYNAVLKLLHVAGLLAGSMATGFAMGLIGAEVDMILGGLPLLGLLTVAAMVSALYPTSGRWPQRRRQLPRWWLQPPSADGALLSGIVFGSGLFTHVGFGVFHVSLLLMAWVGAASGLLWSAMLGLVYGVSVSAMFLHSGRDSTTDLITKPFFSRIQAALIQASRALGVSVFLYLAVGIAKSTA